MNREYKVRDNKFRCEVVEGEVGGEAEGWRGRREQGNRKKQHFIQKTQNPKYSINAENEKP